MVYAREFNGVPHDFGVIGVDNGTLILYDKQTHSWWSQLFGKSVKGPLEGNRLSKIPSVMTTWGKWKALHPKTTVYVKPSIPHKPSFQRESFAYAARNNEGPVKADDLIVGIEGHLEARAYLVRRLVKRRLANDTLESTPILVYMTPDSSTTRIYRREIDGRELHLELVAEERMRDQETGSVWDPLNGVALEGELAGETLQPLVSTYAVWFAWRKYRPDTMVMGESAVRINEAGQD